MVKPTVSKIYIGTDTYVSVHTYDQHSRIRLCTGTCRCESVTLVVNYVHWYIHACIPITVLLKDNITTLVARYWYYVNHTRT